MDVFFVVEMVVEVIDVCFGMVVDYFDGGGVYVMFVEVGQGGLENFVFVGRMVYVGFCC